MSENEYIKTLHDRRMRAWRAAKEILERAATEGRELTADERAAYDKADGEVAFLGKQIEAAIENERRIREQEAAMEELRAKAAANPEYAKADPVVEGAETIRSWVRGDRPEQRAIELVPEKRLLSKGSATAGGNTVPTAFYNQLVEHLIDVSGVLAAGPWEMNTATGESMQVPKTNAHSAKAQIVAEGAQLQDNDPSFGLVTVGAHKYGFLLKLTHELVNDTGVNLMSYISRQAGVALGNGFGEHLVIGTGTGQPQGVATAATIGVTGAGATPTAEELIDLYHSVIAPYRRSSSCGWLMNDKTLAAVRKLRDDSGGAGTGQFLWQPGLVAGEPDTILGKPLFIDPFMPDAAGDGTSKAILFGDFSTYLVRRVEAIRIERSDDFAFDTDMITLRFILRGDGRQIDTTGAVKAFVSGSSGSGGS